MYKLILLISSLIFLGCNNSTKDIEGYYSTHKYSLKDKVVYGLLKDIGIIRGSTLQVNGDSTFEYITCGNIMSGNWRVEDDSLILNIHKHRWKIDSLNINGSNGKCPDDNVGTTKFKLENSAVYNVFTVTVDGKNETFLEKLYKVN